MKRLCGLLVVGLAVLLTGASPALAEGGPLPVVHSERIKLGDSTMTVSFSQWPLRQDRSLDFTFVPAGGIEGRSAKLRAVAPSGEAVGALGQIGTVDDGKGWLSLPRYPRDRSEWGLDVVSLPEEGTWRFEFAVRGPEGTSRGSLPVEVGPQPGPPYALSWAIAMLPWIVLVPLLVYGWVRTRPLRMRATRAWSG